MDPCLPCVTAAAAAAAEPAVELLASAAAAVSAYVVPRLVYFQPLDPHLDVLLHRLAAAVDSAA